jgi:hypothetical protein
VETVKALSQRGLVSAISVAACLALAACGGGSAEATDAGTTTSASSPSTTTTPQSSAAAPTSADPLEADRALVRKLYYDDSQASSGDVRAEAEFTAAHNHPEYHYTADECANYFHELGLTDSYTSSAVPDVTAMALDPGWALPAAAGRYVGLVPSGRVYILPVEFLQEDAQTGAQTDRKEQRHVAILDGAAYYFQACE